MFYTPTVDHSVIVLNAFLHFFHRKSAKGALIFNK